jgi:hypothetical protein
MNRIMSRSSLATALISCALFLAGCAARDQNPIPPAGTSVTSTSEVFTQAARSLEQDCAARGGCTCILDGFEASCSLVFACLDAGFCERVQ